MSARPDKTPADYLAIAVCPPLIMVLVGSFVFFLLQIGYAGEGLGRMRWTLFWFVFAMVLVSRIAIEKSIGAALLYGLALAAATSIILQQYLGFIWGVWLLLGVIWWMTNQVTWDCTLIDEDQDASGQGLLDSAHLRGWLGSKRSQVRAVPAEEAQEPETARSSSVTSPVAVPRPVPLLSTRRTAPPGAAKRKSSRAVHWLSERAKKKQKVHAPGSWVLYFSFAAVPVFGLGELLLARDDTAGRESGFVMLFAYMAACFSLLVITSFLGLRRYLRQRYIRMPTSIVLGWMRSGTTVLVAALALALFLPKPSTPYSLANMVNKIIPREEGDSTSNGRSQRPDGQGPNGTEPQPQSGAQRQKQEQPGGQAAQQQSSTLKPTPGPKTPAFPLEKWLSYALAICVAAFILIRYRTELFRAMASIWAGFLEFWRGLLGGGRVRAVRGPTRKANAPEQRKPDLADPFHNGQAERLSLAELVRYSFDSIQAWAQWRGFVLDESQTPLEFAEALAEREPVLRNELLLLSSYYSHVAYGSQVPPEDCMVVLRRLWMVVSTGLKGESSAHLGRA